MSIFIFPRTILSILLIFTVSSTAQDIHETVRSGDLELLKKLLSNNPSQVNSQDKDKMTPLHHAIDNGNLDVASLLIKMIC